MLEHLTRLARHRAPQRRAELLVAVIDLYRAAGARAEAALGAVFSDIVLQLLPALPVEGQEKVAEKLALLPNLPHALALALCDEEGPAAREILRRSPVLAEDDLVAFAARLPEGRLLAIAGRERLSERVTDALVARDTQALFRAVAANRSARLSSASLQRIVAACGAADPAELRQGAEIVPFPKPRRGRRAERAVVDAPLPAGAVVAWPKAAPAPEARTADTTAVAEAIAAVASNDRMLEVAMLLAAHAGLPPDLVSRLIARPDPSLLVVLCRAAGVSPATFSVIARIRGRRFGHPLKQTLAVEAAYAELSEREARLRLGSLKSEDRRAGGALGR